MNELYVDAAWKPALVRAFLNDPEVAVLEVDSDVDD
jgi:hypothetical protein